MAKLKYTFDDYINNPSGKGSAVNVRVDRSTYEKELMALESKNGKVKYTVYRQSNKKGGSIFYIHFLIPSSTKDFFNDTVIEFKPNEDDNNAIKTIKSFNVRFFSNDSNFVYTYAYTFKSHGVLINELEKLLPFRSIMQKPTMRNPDNAMGYNKSIYFAYLVMVRDDLFKKENLIRISKNGNIDRIKSSILPFDKKEQERNKIIRDSKKAGVKGDIQSNDSKIIKSKNLLGGNSVSNIKPKITKITDKVKKTSIIKKSKKI